MKFSEDKDILEMRGLIVDDPNFENLMQNMEYIAWFYQVSLDEESSKLLADRVPGAAQDETPRPEESFEVFSLELESLDRTQALKDTPERFHDDLFFRNGQWCYEKYSSPPSTINPGRYISSSFKWQGNSQ